MSWPSAEGASIADAARLLTDRRIGALVVTDGDGRLTGIISERDLVRAIARAGAGALAQSVADHMTPEPETCVETDTVESVMETMTRGRFRHVPVLDDGLVSVRHGFDRRCGEDAGSPKPSAKRRRCATISPPPPRELSSFPVEKAAQELAGVPHVLLPARPQWSLAP